MPSPSTKFAAILLALLMASLGHAASRGPQQFLKNSDAWFRSQEARQIAQNILSWQSPHGSWPKNGDTTAQPFQGDPKELKGTFDNGATTDELRFLAHAFRATQEPPLAAAFQRGLACILKAQYATGGWPQYYPPPAHTYHRHITFNDGAMVRLLQFLREVVSSPEYLFVSAADRAAARRSLDRGIQCILKSQINAQGKLSVWCAQHDELDLTPRPGRSYELVSLSGAESAGILQFLMSLDDPTPEVERAVQAGVNWFESAKIQGLRLTVINRDKVAVKDPAAPPLWARFYEIESNRPIFSGRDGIKKYNLAEIELERRRGYAWYGNWGEPLLAEYAQWKQRRQTSNQLNWPEPMAESRPWTRWWWLGSAVDQTNLTQLLTQYRQAGLGGVEICPIYGAKAYENRFIDFLSPQWMDMLTHTTKEADRLSLGVDMTTGAQFHPR